MKRRIATWAGGNYGNVGEETTVHNVEVGDLIYYRLSSNDNKPCIGMVIKPSGVSCVMGSVSDRLEHHVNIRVIVPHEHMTNEILKLHHFTLNFEEVQPTRLTIQQIEDRLGYEVEIVESSIEEEV